MVLCTLPSSIEAISSTLHDPLPLIFRHRAEQGDQSATERRGQIQMWFIENLYKATARVDALDDGYAVEHRPRGAVPFGDDEHVTGAELIDSLLELRTALGILAAGASPARS